MVDFNPGHTDEERESPDRIRLDEKVIEAKKKAANARPKWLFPAIGGGVAAALLAAVLLSGGDDKAEPPAPSVAQTETTATAQPPVVTERQAPPPVVETAPRVPGPAEITAASVAAKRDAIYTGANLHHQAYIDLYGDEVRAGGDFAVHVGVSDYDSSASILIAEGPHAGARIGFFPSKQGDEGRLRVVFEKVGAIETGADGVTPQFVRLPAGDVFRSEIVLKAGEEMQTARQQGFPDNIIYADVALPESARTFTERLPDSPDPAFILKGAPEEGGPFSVTTWNGDEYAFNLDTGAFTVNSVFLFAPDIYDQLDLIYDFDVASNPSHDDYSAYRTLRENNDCALNPDSRQWDECVLIERGADFPDAVNGTVPGVASLGPR